MQALTLPLLSLPQRPLPHPLMAPTVSVPFPTPSWKGVHGGHFRCQDAEGLFCARSANRKAALFFPPFHPLSFGASSPPSWLAAGLWCLYTAVKGHLEGAGHEEVLSGVCTFMGGGGGHGEVGLGSQPSLQEAGSWGPREELPETQGPHCLLYWPWGTLHKETAPSLLAPTSWALGWVGGGEGGKGRSSSGNVEGTYQRIQGQALGEGGRTWQAGPPYLPTLGLGSSPPAVTISTSFCCVLYMDVFISCLTMLCSCGLSTSEETVF